VGCSKVASACKSTGFAHRIEFTHPTRRKFAWSRAGKPLGFDDAIEGSVTELDGQYPVGLGVPLENVADRERRVPLGRKPLLAAAVRDDQYVVEHVLHGSAHAFGLAAHDPLSGTRRSAEFTSLRQCLQSAGPASRTLFA
jgi:hypothetical protein